MHTLTETNMKKMKIIGYCFSFQIRGSLLRKNQSWEGPKGALQVLCKLLPRDQPFKIDGNLLVKVNSSRKGHIATLCLHMRTCIYMYSQQNTLYICTLCRWKCMRAIYFQEVTMCNYAKKGTVLERVCQNSLPNCHKTGLLVGHEPCKRRNTEIEKRRK